MKFHFAARIIFMLLLLNAAGSAYGQTDSSSKLIVHVSPFKAIVILDTMHIRQEVLLHVTPGTHIIKVWAPGRELVIDTFQIYADHFFVFTKNLPYTDSYLQYRVNIRKDRSKALVPLISTGAVLLATGTTLGVLNSRINDNFDHAKSAKAYYDLAITQAQLDYYKNLYDDYRKKYDHLRTTNNSVVVASVILTTAGIATTLYIITKKHAPYTETPLLSRVNTGFLLEGNSGIAGTLTYKF